MDSIVDLLQQDLQEISNDKTCDIPVSGYEKSGLMVRYHLPESGKELDDITRKVEREHKDRYYRQLNIALDTMILLCEGLFVRPDGVEEPVILDPENAGLPVTFRDARLAKIVGLEEDSTARQVVKKLFGHDLAMFNHVEKLSRWLNNTKADLETELWQMGEG